MLELTLNESRKLLSSFSGDLMDQIDQLLQGQGPVECAHFVAKQIKQTAERTGVRTLPMLPSEQNVARKHNGRVTDEQIVRTTLEFLLQLQQRFGAFEKHLNVPAHPVYTDDIRSRQIQIGGKQRQPFVFLGTMADKHDHHLDTRNERGPNKPEDVAILPFNTRSYGV